MEYQFIVQLQTSLLKFFDIPLVPQLFAVNRCYLRTRWIFLIYPRSWSSVVACLRSSSVGWHIVVVSLIYTACTITMGVSSLSFGCFVSVWPWYICTGIASAFVSASFIANMRAVMPCFLVPIISRLISASCLINYRCSTICYLSPKSLPTFWILIGM